MTKISCIGDEAFILLSKSHGYSIVNQVIYFFKHLVNGLFWTFCTQWEKEHLKHFNLGEIDHFIKSTPKLMRFLRTWESKNSSAVEMVVMNCKVFWLTVYILKGGLLTAIHIFKMTKRFLAWKRNIKQVCYVV